MLYQHRNTAQAALSLVVSDAPVSTGDRPADDVDDEEAEIGVHLRSDGYRPLAVDSVRRDAARRAPSLYSRWTFIYSEWLHPFWSHGPQ